MAAPKLELGPCQVWLGTSGAEVWIGDTHGGVKTKMTQAKAALHTDGFGTAPYSEVITGMEVTHEIPLADISPSSLAAAIPGAVYTVQATPDKMKLTFVSPVGRDQRANAKSMILKPIIAGVVSADNKDWYTVPLTAFIGDAELTYDASTQRVWKLMATSYPDPDATPSMLIGYKGDLTTV